MTRLPTDPIDPYESRLAGRVAEHTDRALRPFDAMAIAHAASGAAPRRRFGRLLGVAGAFYRLGWVAAAALLAVMVVGGGGFLPGGAGGPSPTVPAVSQSPVPSAPATSVPTAVVMPAPTPTVRPIVACIPGDLTMEILSWSGAAGQRVATLKLTNTGPVPCRFFSVTRPQLVDGTGSVLIDGTDASGGSTLLLAVGASLTTMAEDGNYCGPDPVAPITVAIVLPGDGRIVAKPLSATDVTGLAPCMGSGSGAYIDMHEWQP